MIACHQLLPNFNGDDAIGNHVLAVRAALRDAGFDSEIFAEEVKPAVRGEAQPYRCAPTTQGTWWLYHLSTADPEAGWLAEAEVPLVIGYHNITPAEYFDRWMPDAADASREARRQLRLLAPRATFGLAMSSYNAAELSEAGCRDVSVAPVLVDFARYDVPGHPGTEARLRRLAERGGARWLYVGRFVANKAQHDVVAAFAAYRHAHDPQARLSLVGEPTMGRYVDAVARLADDLGVADAVEFHHRIALAELVAEYRAASVYVSLSEHEGFCVPVLEAMHFGVPVVAQPAGAVPETVGDAAVLVDSKDPAAVASTVHSLLGDGATRARLGAAGRERVAHFGLEASRRRLLDAIAAAANL